MAEYLGMRGSLINIVEAQQWAVERRMREGLPPEVLLDRLLFR